MVIYNINNDFDLIVASALRVALIEKSNLSLIVQEFIIENTHILSDKIKKIFIRDIKDREQDKIYGEMSNKESWNNLVKELQRNISGSIESNIKISENIEIKDKNFEIIVETAVRYGLGRRTYITRVIPEFVIANLDILSDGIKRKMIKDIEEQKDYGDECDKLSWMQLLEKLKEELY